MQGKKDDKEEGENTEIEKIKNHFEHLRCQILIYDSNNILNIVLNLTPFIEMSIL